MWRMCVMKISSARRFERITALAQVTDADMQDPELLAEMHALMGGEAPSAKPAPKPPTAQELTVQLKQYRQQAIALKQQGQLNEARNMVRMLAISWPLCVCRCVWLYKRVYTHGKVLKMKELKYPSIRSKGLTHCQKVLDLL